MSVLPLFHLAPTFPLPLPMELHRLFTDLLFSFDGFGGSSRVCLLAAPILPKV